MLTPKTSFNTPLQQILLLEERVRRTGASLPEDTDQQERFHGIKCVIKGRQCLINIREVAAVIEDKNVTPVPGTAEWIEGVMNYRGALVPVYDISAYLVEEEDPEDDGKSTGRPLLVLRHGQEFSAIRVDRVTGMKKVPLEDFEQVDNDSEDPYTLDYYTDTSIELDESRWWRFTSRRLLASMGEEDPMLQAMAHG